MEQTLKEKLDAIPDSYDMFSECIIRGCKTVENGIERMMKKISAEPKITSSDIVVFLYKMRHPEYFENGENRYEDNS